MGFTRYWEFESLDKDKFVEFTKVCQIFIDELSNQIELDGVIINDRTVKFNGVDDDAHETFFFDIGKTGFNFCKTNAKPYDVVVCGCLYVSKLVFGDSIKINQDCDPSADEENIQIVKSIIRENKLNKILENENNI
jgi:hypothetical protein